MNYTNFISKIEEFDSFNFTENNINNYTILNEEFSEYFIKKINKSIRMKKIIQKVLDSIVSLF